MTPVTVKLLLIFGFLVAAAGPGCAPLHTKGSWNEWKKNKDAPGLAYRAICKGRPFDGSKFYKWEIHIKNDYYRPANFSVAIGDLSDEQKSERYRVKLVPGDVRRVTFYTVRIPPEAPHKVMFFDVALSARL